MALFGRPAVPSTDRIQVVRVANAGTGSPISSHIYGSNEIGTMDGAASAPLDRTAGVTLRRLGGNLMTTYNWTNNASNSGKDDLQANRTHWLDLLELDRSQRHEPGSVIAAMHRTSLGMGATSIVTLPLAGFVAADADGPVGRAEAAPSRRFVPVVWSSRTRASDPIDPTVADVPQLLRRLQNQFGSADDATGIRAYALDNEPDIWFQTHPRVVPSRITIADVLARSIRAAQAIKAIDPAAWVLGPVSWGPTGMATFQDAPDWGRYAHHGSFIAAYLDAFRQASEQAGIRLLDQLDVHWYAFSDHGSLFRSEDPRLATFILDAPRSLTEQGFREESWVTKALPVSDQGGLSLPILPSLERLAASSFPGTRIAITEFNYGGAGSVASGLAVADALGRYGRASVSIAAHWGSLAGWLNQAYRLYRNYDGRGGRFGDMAIPVDVGQPDGLSGFASVAGRAAGPLQVILINKSERELAVDLVLEVPLARASLRGYGFDAAHPVTGPIGPPVAMAGTPTRLQLPPRSARHYVIEA